MPNMVPCALPEGLGHTANTIHAFTGRRRHLGVYLGTSLVVQWLRLCVPNTGRLDSIPSQGTRSHMPQLKVHRGQPKIPTQTNKLNLKKKVT